MNFAIFRSWRKFRQYGHIPAMIFLQLFFIIMFAIFVIYKPDNVSYGPNSLDNATDMMNDYPLFQDVHVMIFIGFGFLMTFLKKYGLSAVSLNMMCAVLSLQWATLVIGFFHLHYENKVELKNGTEIVLEKYSYGKIYLDLFNSMLLSDFASAAVLISFGVVIGTTSPLQLIAMTMIEIVIFTVNEVIGRKYLGAIDAGDTIFVHLFGAYFGLAVSRVLYSKDSSESSKQGSNKTSDLFSMVGTVFLWMFWPSFNSAAALRGEAQHRAVLNTYYSLCASVMSSFALSALINEHNKFVMEHIQNATLAGGVAIGAVADLFIQPYGALIVGSFAGMISVLGFEFVSPWLAKNLWMNDTCGVHNLHGMPGVFGTLLSVLMAALASEKDFGGTEGLHALYPAFAPKVNESGHAILAIGPNRQALNQLLAGLITLSIAVVGGLITGFIMKMIGKCQSIGKEDRRPGSTVVKLVLNVGNVFTGQMGLHHALPKDAYFDDNLFFEVHDDEKQPIAIHHSGSSARFDVDTQMRRLSEGIKLHSKLDEYGSDVSSTLM